MKQYILKSIIGVLLVTFFVSCNDFLDREPLDKITPEVFFSSESDLESYTAKQYENAEFQTIKPGEYGISVFKSDNHTDNQAGPRPDSRWMPGEWRVTNTSEKWNFESIRSVNYFLERVIPKFEKKEITGNQTKIKHYIGEMYVMRANIYFDKLKAFGDFPIIKSSLPDKEDELIEASKRKPRNEVARFIISDLDKAIKLLQEDSPNGKNRISKNVAYLLKSRVALYEGTWLKYHKGTAQVPGGTGWPSKEKIKINIDNEIKFFLSEAVNSSKIVGDQMLNSLTENSGKRTARSSDLKSLNDYYMMFADDDMEKYPEVLLWRKYAIGEATHNIQMELISNGGSSGYTRGLVESFLMKNGLPIYASESGYAGDTSLENVIKDRDSRLQLFTKIKGDVIYYNKDNTPVLSGPQLIVNNAESRSVTGYTVKKGMNYNSKNMETHHTATTGSIVFRGVEALLNYIEASYILNNSINGTAANYWKAIRNRAGVDSDFNKTIAATNMTIEAKGDFGAYSHGKIIDKTLYNIRRERRNEFIAEGMRWMDLKRWRAMDQIIESPYIVEGFHLWNTEIESWYKKEELYVNAEKGRVSPKKNSEYLRPYQIVQNKNLYYDGYKWHNAHYLNPLPMSAFNLTTKDKNVLGSSVVYQNPGWPMNAGGAPSGI